LDDDFERKKRKTPSPLLVLLVLERGWEKREEEGRERVLAIVHT